MKHSVLPQGREKLFNELRVERNAGLGTHVLLNLTIFFALQKTQEKRYTRDMYLVSRSDPHIVTLKFLAEIDAPKIHKRRPPDGTEISATKRE